MVTHFVNLKTVEKNYFKKNMGNPFEICQIVIIKNNLFREKKKTTKIRHHIVKLNKRSHYFLDFCL